MNDLYRKTCTGKPHTNPSMGGRCSDDCYEPVEIMKELSWCRQHNRYANFTGSRGLTCGWPGQEECWIVPCVVVWMGDPDE